jgi:Flp pilus assembly protein TadG
MSCASNSAAPTAPAHGTVVSARQARTGSRRRVIACRRGVTSLEWALVSVAFMLLFISIIDLARYMIVLQSVANVMAEQGRQCQVSPGNCASSGWNAAAWGPLSNIAPLLDTSQFVITAATGNNASTSPYPSAYPAAVNIVQVTVSYPYQAWSPWLSSLNATVTETATYFN